MLGNECLRVQRREEGGRREAYPEAQDHCLRMWRRWVKRRVQRLGICACVVEKVEEEGRGVCPEAPVHGWKSELGILPSDPWGTRGVIEQYIYCQGVCL